MTILCNYLCPNYINYNELDLYYELLEKNYKRIENILDNNYKQLEKVHKISNNDLVISEYDLDCRKEDNNYILLRERYNKLETDYDKLKVDYNKLSIEYNEIIKNNNIMYLLLFLNIISFLIILFNGFMRHRLIKRNINIITNKNKEIEDKINSLINKNKEIEEKIELNKLYEEQIKLNKMYEIQNGKLLDYIYFNS